MNDMTSPPATDVIAKSNSIFDSLPKLSACAVMVTAVLSVCGYRVNELYFAKLGAPWAVDLLTPNALIFSALPLVLVFCFALFYGARYGRKAAERGRIPWWTLAGLVVSTVSLVIIMVTKEPRYGYWAGFSLVASYVVVVAGSAAQVSAALVRGKTFASPELFVTLESIAFFIFIFSPPNLGIMLARRDADPTLSPLAVVSIEGKEGEHWRLVKALGDRALLIKLANVEADREFRVVATDKLSVRFSGQ